MPQVQTIQDLMDFVYRGGKYTGYGFSPNSMNFFGKADDPYITSTTGVFNTVFGSFAWSQLNLESNALGAIPKIPWIHSGWRAITARPEASGGGQSETASTLPDSNKYDQVEISTNPKIISHVTESGIIQSFLATTKDDSFGTMAQTRPLLASRHREMMNVALMANYNDAASSAVTQLDSIDRVTASSTERVNAGETADREDIYSLDRSASNIHNATVVAGTTENSNIDRALTETLLSDWRGDIKDDGGTTTFYLTGHDTMGTIEKLYSTKVRYAALGESIASFGVNGIQTATGINVGEAVSTLFRVPIIESKNTVKDTGSRIYALDTTDPDGTGQPRLSIKTAIPTQYFEAGFDQGTPFAINKFSSKGMLVTLGEIICTRFKGQSKMRDLL